MLSISKNTLPNNFSTFKKVEHKIELYQGDMVTLPIYQSPLSNNVIALTKYDANAEAHQDKIMNFQCALLPNENIAFGNKKIGRTSCILPWSIVEKIYSYILQSYSIKKSRKDLTSWMLLGSDSLYIVNRVLTLNRVVQSNWIKDQMRYCSKKIKATANDAALKDFELIQLNIKNILTTIQHIHINMKFIKPDRRFLVLDALSRKTDIKSLEFWADDILGYSSDEVINQFIDTLADILKNNKELHTISYLSLEGNKLHAAHIKKLAEALLGKNINLISFERNKINIEEADILKNTLKKININNVYIHSTHEPISHLAA